MNNKIKDITDIPYHLNMQLCDDPIEIFSYQNSGYYEAIKFGEYILWDTDGHDFNYQKYKAEDYLDMLTHYVKEQFNEYLSTLKKYRFLDVIKDKDIIDGPFDATDEISNEIFKKYNIKLSNELFHRIENIIEKYN